MKSHILLLTSIFTAAPIYAADTPLSDPKISHATQQGSENIAATLVNTPNSQGRTPLHIMTYTAKGVTAEQRNNAIRLLIQNGASVNAQDNDGNTALHFCAAYGTPPETVQLLKSFGADPMLTNKKGYTPLLTAIEHGYIHYTQCIEVYLHSNSAYTQNQSDQKPETKG